jgi:hypothetical protein
MSRANMLLDPTRRPGKRVASDGVTQRSLSAVEFRILSPHVSKLIKWETPN